jgi:membrane protein required for colicin V production
MTFFDFVLLLILFGFVWFGFWFGLIYSLGGILGIIFGAILASRWYELIASKLLFLFGGNETLAKVVCFLVLFVVIWRLISFLVSIINRIFNLLTFIPFLKTINRLAGALFGFLEGALILGLILYFLSKFPIGNLKDLIENSNLAQLLIKIAKIIFPFLPKAFRELKSLI